MKTRSEVKRLRTTAEVQAHEKKNGREYTGTKCAVEGCGHLQFLAPNGSGAMCANGHGGSPGIPIDNDATPDDEKAAMAAVREKAAGKKAAPAEEEAAEPVRKSYEWPNANKGKEVPIRDDLRRVVETVFTDDIFEEWKYLERCLEIGEKRTEHGHIVIALDKAAKRAYRAHRLYITAKQAREKWEAQNEPVWGAMWLEATRSLQTEKDSGQRSKQITDADVKATCAVLYPDQYRDQEDRRRSADLTVKSLERLSDIWFQKLGNLQTHLARSRG